MQNEKITRYIFWLFMIVNMELFCPRCKSKEIVRDPNMLHGAMGMPSKYICNECGFTANHFPVTDQELNEEPVEIKSLPQHDMSLGEFEVGIIWKISGPFTIAVGIFGLFHQFWYGLFLLGLGIVMTYVGYKKKVKIKK
jgi:predicted RNA-binding Zn-ribbon protein involved in translation (DUF1610 family)